MSQRKKIGRYFLKDLLGEGAMGSVFQAHDPNLERDVAIKTMRTGKLKKKNEYSEFKKRFFLEAKANGRLNHPNIVSVYDSGVEDDEPYLVMEFIQGKALDTYVEEDFDNRPRFLHPTFGANGFRLGLCSRGGRHSPRCQAGQHPRFALSVT